MADNKATDAEFENILNDILALSQQFPQYRFEQIHHYVEALRQGQQSVSQLVDEFRQILPERQDVGLNIFNYALTRAKQANYQPVNGLDTFIEHQLYGVQDDKVVEKGLVGNLVRQNEPKPVPPQRPPKRPGGKPTNPLNPRALPPQHKQD